VGRHHDNPKCRCRSRPRRLRLRICLRKGCGRQYQPRRWNQLYCQDPECLRLVRCWQAARRQAERRQDEAVKAERAKAARARRRRRTKSLPQAPNDSEVTVARGHAAKIILPTPMCDRPGCYEPPAKSGRSQARFCGPACRHAVRQVFDRERKWLSRGTFRGRPARVRKYMFFRRHRRRKQPNKPGPTPPRASPG
jgi:hypothetical protein